MSSMLFFHRTDADAELQIALFGAEPVPAEEPVVRDAGVDVCAVVRDDRPAGGGRDPHRGPHRSARGDHSAAVRPTRSAWLISSMLT